MTGKRWAMVGLLASLPLRVALADDSGGWSGEQEGDDAGGSTSQDTGAPSNTDGDESSAASPPPAIDPSEAQPVPALSRSQLDWLRPDRGKLPQNPYTQRNFNAYTLEFGEVQIGLGAITMGVLPRVQLGTSPVLDALKIWNLSARVNALRLGPLDLAAAAGRFQMVVPGAGDQTFSGSLSRLGGLGSLRMAKPWTVHGGAWYNELSAEGLPDLAHVSSMLLDVSESEARAWLDEAAAKGVSFDAHARAVSVQAATDLRLNRRDSFVLQAQAYIWADAAAGVTGLDQIPPVLGLDKLLAASPSGNLPLSETYVVSLSYQAEWKHLDLRLGPGRSAIPYAWLLQSTDLSWRFGGHTRSSERRMNRTWRRNKREAGRGDVPDDPGQ